MTPSDDALNVLSDLIARARKAGADAADGVLVEGISISHAQRLGEIEKLERSEGYDLGLRVLIGRHQAIVSSNDRSPAALEGLVSRALRRARAGPADPYCALAAPPEIARPSPTLDAEDPVDPTAEILIERARAASSAARARSIRISAVGSTGSSASRVTNSEG